MVKLDLDLAKVVVPGGQYLHVSRAVMWPACSGTVGSHGPSLGS